MKKIILVILISGVFTSIAKISNENHIKIEVILPQPTPCDRSKDSLTIKDLNFKLNRVRFYVKLVDKKPSQQKYLKGWIKRVIK